MSPIYIKMVTPISQNIPKYECKDCDIKTNNKKDFKKHQFTAKHQKKVKGDILGDNVSKNPLVYECYLCNKIYNSRNGLWKHKKKCMNEEDKLLHEPIDIDDKQTINLLIKENIDFKNIILDLVKNNGDFQKQTLDMQKQMIDVCKTSGTNNSYNNSNNKTFNMQVFLNEKCKDAMNIMDFVNSMTLQLSDLEDVGELGYVEGISKIIIRKLNEMDVYKRPIHCSDYKREVMYVRDDDIWEKENSTFDKLRKAIKHITKKNGDLMIPWRDQNPQCMNNRHRLNDIYLRIMNQSMGGKGEFVDSENKIIKKLSKAVFIDKHL